VRGLNVWSGGEEENCYHELLLKLEKSSW
jgi:hypothetical protein